MGDSRDLDMILRMNRKLSNCSEEGNDKDSEIRLSDVVLYYKERTKDVKIERIMVINNIFENIDMRFGNKLLFERNLEKNSLNI